MEKPYLENTARLALRKGMLGKNIFLLHQKLPNEIPLIPTII
jgi:hypothetical protein